jgi:hypothetical protein
VVCGGVVQGVYANWCGPLTVYLLDYDDLRADDNLAEAVGRTAELPQVAVEAGLARAVAEYHALACRQATRRRRGPENHADADRSLRRVPPAGPRGPPLSGLPAAGAPALPRRTRVPAQAGSAGHADRRNAGAAGGLSRGAHPPGGFGARVASDVGLADLPRATRAGAGGD